MTVSPAPSKPNALVGVGLRHSHYSQALSNNTINDTIDFVELHAENFFAAGGIAKELLRDVSNKYQVSIHGTSLGLGSNMPVPKDTLEQFASVVEYTGAKWVSEHLCFNRAHVNGQTLHSGDLLPLAYNQKSLLILRDNITQVQDRLNRPILIENLSAYIEASAFDCNERDDLCEMEFLIELCETAGCGLLLDINNLIVNAINQGHEEVVTHVYSQLKTLPKTLIGEIHLAGFSDKQVNGFIVDDHANAVSKQCWSLYEKTKQLFGNVPTLIEWDNNLPTWEVLVNEAQKARDYQCNIKNA